MNSFFLKSFVILLIGLVVFSCQDDELPSTEKTVFDKTETSIDVSGQNFPRLSFSSFKDIEGAVRIK